MKLWNEYATHHIAQLKISLGLNVPLIRNRIFGLTWLRTIYIAEYCPLRGSAMIQNLIMNLDKLTIKRVAVNRGSPLLLYDCPTQGGDCILE